MHTVITLPDLRTARLPLSGTVGLVPTMGYLHEGHLSLIRRAREECEHVVVSDFRQPDPVRPQRGPGEVPARPGPRPEADGAVQPGPGLDSHS